MGQPLLITAKIASDSAHRQIERWASPLQLIPLISVANWTLSSSAGISIDLNGFVHLHGVVNYNSVGAISGTQTIAKMPSPGVPTVPANATMSTNWGGALGSVVAGSLVVTAIGGLVQIYMAGTSSNTVQVNLTGLLYHPQLL